MLVEKSLRTPLMEALCILSFMGNGLAIAVFLAAALMNTAAREWMAEWSSNSDVSRFTTGYFLIATALYLLSLTGVLGMWKMKKQGFILYVIARCGILCLPFFWLDDPFLPSVAVIFTLLFVGLYAREISRRVPHSLEP